MRPCSLVGDFHVFVRPAASAAVNVGLMQEISSSEGSLTVQ